jgi:Zn finger protein HypA/HybF involved in hydrogenase expression
MNSENGSFCVPIDRKTIRRNPSAGRSLYGAASALGSVTLLLTLNSSPESESASLALKKPLLYAIIVSTTFATTQDNLTVSCVVKDSLTVTKATEEIERVTGCKIIQLSSTTTREVSFYESIATAPAFLYKYLPVKLKCGDCAATFAVEELEQDCDYDYYIRDICPVCGTSDCCDYYFELLNSDQLSALADANKNTTLIGDDNDGETD